MNNTSSLEQISYKGYLEKNLILRQYELFLMDKFMEIKLMNIKSTQKEIAKELGYPFSSLQRYRQDIIMLSAYRIPPSSHKRKKKISNRKHDLGKPHFISKDLERPQITSKESSPIFELVKPKKKN